MSAALLLLPNLLGDFNKHELFLPSSVDKAVSTLDGLIAESDPQGRRYLGRFATKKPPHLMPIAVYNHETPDTHLDFLLEPIQKGERWGYVSDSGLPCIADPGSKLVLRAKQMGILVQAFVGPSSILIALMLSGLSGERFSFNGYLERDPTECRKKLALLEKRASSENSTQIFMEPPYRNQKMLELLMECLNDETTLSIAWDLTMPTQGVLTQKVNLWKKSPLPNLAKKNALFLIH
jgi:16S rRNA (cytidine1402-2'-O)-methyltransferase